MNSFIIVLRCPLGSYIQSKDKNNHIDIFCVWLLFSESYVSVHPPRNIQKAAGMLQSGLSRLRQARGAVCPGRRVRRRYITLLANHQFSLPAEPLSFQKHKMANSGVLSI